MSGTHHASSASPRTAFGLALRGYRNKAGLSQEGLAEKAGVHRTYISSVERGQRNVGLDNICRIAEALSISPADLFGGLS